QIEGDGDRRQLALARHRHRPRSQADARHGIETHLLAGIRADVNLRQHAGVERARLVGLHDHRIVVGWGVDGGDLARAEGGIERRAEGVHGYAVARQLIAIDVDRKLAGAEGQVAGNVGKPWRLLDAVDQPLRIVVELVLIDAGQRVLIERGAAAAADAQVLQRYRERADAGDPGQATAQAILHVADAAPVHA